MSIIQKLVSNKQRGIVSIVVTMLMVMIITIIIIAFGSFSQREQKQTFERQLSSEAFYAAESGISNAIEILKNTPSGTGLLVDEKKNCTTGIAGFDYELDGSDNVAISCLLVDPAPYSIEISNLSLQEPYVLPLDRFDPGTVDQVTIHWHDPAATSFAFTGCDGSNALPPSWPANCNAGMLKIDIIPIPASFNYNYLTSSANTKTVFIKPTTGALTDISYGGLTSGDIRTARCQPAGGTYLSATQPKHCAARLTGLTAAPKYYLRITPLYLSASLTICSEVCGEINAGNTHRLAGAQAKVDSTGRASGVLRRIQVQVDISGLNENGFAPVGIGSTNSLCKRFSTRPTSSTDGNVSPAGGGC